MFVAIYCTLGADTGSASCNFFLINSFNLLFSVLFGAYVFRCSVSKDFVKRQLDQIVRTLSFAIFVPLGNLLVVEFGSTTIASGVFRIVILGPG